MGAKRKREGGARPPPPVRNGQISSDDDRESAQEEEDDAFFETADEKRVRLAKTYLKEVGEDVGKEVDARLQKDLAQKQHASAHSLASSWRVKSQAQLKGHKRSATCVCVTAGGHTAFTGGKDCAVLAWDVERGAKRVFPGGRNRVDSGGHFKEVRGVACTADGATVVSGGLDRLVRVWDARAARTSFTLRGHDGDILSVAMDPDGDKIYSCAADKTIKVWSLGMQTAMDTLFGHTAPTTCMDIFQTSKLVTGGEDRTTRSWKIQGGTHLLYTHHESSVDGVCAIDATTFASVGQDGRLAVGSSASKKPLAVVERAHGSSWLTAVACARLSDVVVSGGGDGALRFWQLRKAAESGKTAKRELVALATVPAEGHVNQIAVDKGGRLVFAAMGNEHKFGSWTRESGARKNGLLVVRVEHDGPVELY